MIRGVGARDSGSHPLNSWVGARDSGSDPLNIWVGARDSGSHQYNFRVGAGDSGSHPYNSWVGARDSGSHPFFFLVGSVNYRVRTFDLTGCKIPSFFNFLKKIGNAQKNIICTALALNHRPKAVQNTFNCAIPIF